MKVSEENVVQQIKVKNEKAITFMIQQYGGLIHTIIYHHLRHSREDQEECLDDVLLAIWYNINSFNPTKNSFKNWIAAVAKYKAIDYQRRYIKRLQQQFSVSEIEESMMKRKEEVFSRDVSILFEQLSTEDRRIFERFYLEDEPSSHIAEELNVKVSWIYNKLSRGRKKLRHFLTQGNKS